MRQGDQTHNLLVPPDSETDGTAGTGDGAENRESQTPSGADSALPSQSEAQPTPQNTDAGNYGDTMPPAMMPGGTDPVRGVDGKIPPDAKDLRPQGMLSQADLSNFYTVRLDASGDVLSWYSDRSELYSDQQIAESAAEMLALGTDWGRSGSQFFIMGRRPYESLLVVLDGRLEMESARQLLVISSLVGLAAYLLLIRRMTKPVQESFDKQKQFVMDASHELKTPLAAISANSEALAGEIGENRWLGYIQSEVQRTDQLVKNLLTLARMDRVGQQLEKHPFDLSRAVLSVTLPFESMAFETGKTMVTDVAPNLQYNGNEEMLKQMAVILIDNALKYANDGGTVTVSLLVRGDRRILRVHNTGVGIKQEDLPRIFERFYRADKAHSREKEGNGLGLAIAKTIVTAHKGKIAVESEPGHWACFTVTL
ncbi:putative two-component histidine kinase [Oscillibacter valericigenes Sjm18-20]|nr:putative two-component histidine kinase [Oscillibacter valericigenes Sjm18-20]